MPINAIEQKVLDMINPDRLLNLHLDLVRIPSPTGHERPIAEFYAKYLRDLGLDVSLDSAIPASPNVIGWLRGRGDGKTLQLNGHLDTIPLDHEPACFKDGCVYGRGSCDQKAGVAAMTEAAQAILESGVTLKGNVLLTATGTHERPGARKEGVIALAQHGPLGDAIVITEAGDRGVPVVQKGMAVFDIVLSRPGTTRHEMRVEPGTPNPVWAGWRMLELLRERQKSLEAAGSQHHLLIPDTIFVGLVQSGDFYNTLPTSFRILGARRWSPGIDYAGIEAEFAAMAEQVERETGTTVEVDLDKVGDPSQVCEEEPIVRLLQDVHQDLTGQCLPTVGLLGPADAWIFNNIGHVPTTYYSADGSRAHATPEYVPFDEVMRAARAYTLAALRFAGVAD